MLTKLKFIAVLAIIAGYNIYELKNNTDKDMDLTLNDVEALADEEWSDLLHCSCGLLWGSGCKRDNWGVGCAVNSETDCSKFDGNCS